MDKLTGFFELADSRGFVVVAPDGLGRAWNDGRTATSASAGGVDDIAFLRALIDRIEAQTAIDDARVYVTGMSNGAMMSGRIACEMADRVAAIAQVAGTAPVDVAAACRPGKPVPLLEIHGTSDPLVPYAGGTVAPQLGGRGQVVGVDEWAQFWVANNGSAAAPDSSIGGDTSVRTWHGATPQSDVVFYRIAGAGHTWPGGRQYLPKFIIGSTSNSFAATDVIWTFLSAHHRG